MSRASDIHYALRAILLQEAPVWNCLGTGNIPKKFSGILNVLSGVQNYIDDILVFGKRGTSTTVAWWRFLRFSKLPELH